MAQRFKSVYFADGLSTTGQRALTLAFNSRDGALYEHVRRLSSQEVREWLGHSSHQDLITAARQDDLPVNTYCIRRLRQIRQQYTVNGSGDLFADSAIRSTPLVRPADATFRGGQSEPLHDWCPSIE